MRDERKRPPNPSKLLRVLVAGGVALIGAAAPRAEEKGDGSGEKTEKMEKAPAKEAKQKPKGQKDQKDAKKKADAEKKPDEGGGVKGW